MIEVLAIDLEGIAYVSIPTSDGRLLGKCDRVSNSYAGSCGLVHIICISISEASCDARH